MFKTAVSEAETKDIIYSLAIAVPKAIQQAKEYNLPEIIGATTGNVVKDAEYVGKWIRANVKYQIDSFENQNIQFPSSLLKTKSGDCKSFSLLFLSIMEAAGYNSGFRFASYKTKSNFTHVYNFVVNPATKEKIIIDCCIRTLREGKTYKKIKDMRVNYLGNVPAMIDESIIAAPTAEQLITDDRYLSLPYIGKKPLKDRLKAAIDKAKEDGKKVKTVLLAPARGSFLLLLDVNFRGLARKMAAAISKNEKKVNEFWLKLGGDFSKFKKAVNVGKNKKAFLGEKKGVNGIEQEEYLGFDPATVTTALASASAIVAAAKKLFESLGVKPKENEGNLPEGPPISENGEKFIPTDPAGEAAIKYAETGKVTSDSSFKPSPALIIGAVALIGGGIYLATKKK